MNNILFIFWVTLVLYVLLETDAVPKWARFLDVKWLKYEEYEKKQEMFGSELKYRVFLSSNYKNFFVFLLTCQECLCVWLNIIGFNIFKSELGGWGFFGVTTIFSLVTIAALNFILRKLYE